MHVFFLFVTSFIYGVGFIFQKISAGEIPATLFNAIRFLVGALVILPLFWRFKDEKYFKKSVLLGLGTGFLTCIASFFQQTALEYSTVSNLSVFSTLISILVPLGSIIFGYRLSKRQFFGVFLSFIGLGIINYNPAVGLVFDHGTLLIFGSLLVFTLQIICLSKFGLNTEPFTTSFFIFVSACFFSFFANSMFYSSVDIEKISYLISPILSGVLVIGLGFTLQVIGQKFTPPALANIILLFEYLFGILVGVLYFKEHLNSRFFIGAFILFTSVILIQERLQKASLIKSIKKSI